MAAGPVRVDRLAVACGALGLLVVLAAAVEGTASPQGDPPALREQPAPVPGAPSPTRSPRLPHLPARPGSELPALQGALLVAAGVAALVVVALVLRWLWRRRSQQGRPGPSSALVGDDPVAPGASPPGAPVVRRGIARALDLLAEDRPPGDAVVQAWLGLEQAAEDSGHPRARAETPTEFTARLLGRVPADRAAVQTLLGLYSRARFAAHGGDRADAVRARAALEALARSWQDGGPRER